MGYPCFEVYFPSFQTEPDHTQGKKIEPQHTQHIFNKDGIKGGAAGGHLPHHLSTKGQLKIAQAEIHFRVAR